ncbi:hypothetical protein EVA_17998 [gut metagenome]|uniref:Uncharacterized protein n=1 Tax=gut metagenome TaxID=749906 RepID=J9C242_9ZZZZ
MRKSILRQLCLHATHFLNNIILCGNTLRDLFIRDIWDSIKQVLQIVGCLIHLSLQPLT